MRLNSLLCPLCICTLLTTTSNLYADNIYLGGPHAFSPLTDAKTLTIHAGDLPVLPLPAHTQHTLSLSMLISAPDTRKTTSGIGLALINEKSDTLSLTLRYLPGQDQIYDKDRLLITIAGQNSQHTATVDCTPSDFRVGEDAAFTLHTDPLSDPPSISLLCGRRQNHTLWHSDNSCPEITNFLTPSSPSLKSIGFSSLENSKINIKRINLVTPDAAPSSATPSSIEEIKNAIENTQDAYAGFWTLLDYTLDDAYIRPGGNYLLAFLPTSDGCYDIIYLEGATINPGKWHMGDTKGTLTPTRLPGLYRLQWYDAERLSIDPGATLQFTGTDILTLTLPQLNSTIRFHRVPTP